VTFAYARYNAAGHPDSGPGAISSPRGDPMKLVSVNVSLPKDVPYRGGTIRTGIFKEPVRGRVMVRTLNIDGDGQGDLKVHGGRDMAVYAYPVEHYAFWEKELGRASFPRGQFGENLTVQGVSESDVRVGDIVRVGGARLQVTQPRIPCSKLALRMETGMDFLKRFLASGRSGYYLRVLEEGEIGAGDAIELIDTDESSATIEEFLQTYIHGKKDPERLRSILLSRDLADAWRGYFEEMLSRVGHHH
jgi:MOSC domain-containing protein YiiM